MLHKTRTVLGKRDSFYELSNYIEMDEGFFKSSNDEKDDKPLKRGRGSHKQSKVIVAIESKPIKSEDKQAKYKHKPEAKVGYLKMIVLENLEAENISENLTGKVNEESIVRTDRYKGYTKLRKQVKEHQVYRTFDKEVIEKTFPWVHTAISNAKRLFLGIHHSIKDCYMQNYLDKYTYKFNRRYFGDALFDRMLVAAVTNVPYEKGLIADSQISLFIKFKLIF
jgi:transposase-like protein